MRPELHEADGAANQREHSAREDEPPMRARRVKMIEIGMGHNFCGATRPRSMAAAPKVALRFKPAGFAIEFLQLLRDSSVRPMRMHHVVPAVFEKCVELVDQAP